MSELPTTELFCLYRFTVCSTSSDSYSVTLAVTAKANHLLVVIIPYQFSN